ncbi:MAG: YraN family protein [Candidatus Blackburnbacteria bacterium]|nr:YraN family protein [Candidatus Blackburnbacteria bacterium]
MDKQATGRLGEDLAVGFLQKQGYKILTRNFRSHFGEVDIVAQDKKTLVFVEVKMRDDYSFGYPEEAVTPRKISSIIKTGQYYKLVYPGTPSLMRVDVVAIDMIGDQPQIRLHKNITL